jgi:hypothetical protein
MGGFPGSPPAASNNPVSGPVIMFVEFFFIVAV